MKATEEIRFFMQLKISPRLDGCPSADLLVLPCWSVKGKAEIALKMKAMGGMQKPLEDFSGKEGESLLVYPTPGKEKRILLVGLGDKKKISAEALRHAYYSATKRAIKKKWVKMNAAIPEECGAMASAICNGILEANYRWDKWKTDNGKEIIPATLASVCLAGLDKEHQKECEQVVEIFKGVDLARDLVNANAEDMHPDALAEAAKKIQKEFPKVKVTVLNKNQIAKEKMGLLMAVGKGALHGPNLILMEYRGDPDSKETYAIVGKGITFDTGGLNLKPTGSMETMKCDMAGGAAVIGTLRTLAALKIKRNVIGVIAAAENAIGPASVKPGDVHRGLSGKTVEINNTDAEGRLVLADALTYVQNAFSPTHIIDLGTLTGGMVIVLGEDVTGFFATDDALASALFQAGESCGERVWRMPLYPVYRDLLKSSIADIKNSGPRKATAIQAAIFLQEFINKDVPWVHLDIAGTAYNTESYASGVGVRLLTEFFQKHGK